MNLKRIADHMIRSRPFARKCVAFILSLSILIGYALPLDCIMTAFAASENVVPSGSYEINNDITGIGINLGDGQGTYDSGTNTITAGEGLDQVDFDMTVNFLINDHHHDKVDTNKPYIYLKVPKDQLNIFGMSGSGSGTSDDQSSGWSTYKQANNLDATLESGTFTVYDTGNDDYGYVVLEFNNDYINYLKQSGGIIKGSLSFQGEVVRSHLQNGDKVVNLGNVSINVDFDDRIPDVQKTGRIDHTDDLGYPIIRWELTITDLYETDNYHISDAMFGSMIPGSFSCNPNGVCFMQNGDIVFNNSINEHKQFTISYETRVAPEELNSHNETFNVTNTASIGNNSDTASVPVTPDSQPHVEKSGTADYNYQGDRSGEETGKYYIYWTVEARKNYGLGLGGVTLTDVPGSGLGNIELISASDGSNPLNVNNLLTISGNDITFNSGVNNSYVKLVYRTEVDPDSSESNFTNTVSTANETKTQTVNYNKSSKHTSGKSGSYRIEDNNGVISEFIDWTITLETNDWHEKINGYEVEDSAFASGAVWKNARAVTKSDQYIDISASDISQWISVSGNKLTVSSSQPDIKRIELTYSVPVGAIEGRDATHGGTATNTYKVEDDEPQTATVSVPDLAGSSQVVVNKHWDNNEDPNRESTKAQFKLYYKIGQNGSWGEFHNYQNGYDDVIEVSATYDQQVIFNDLPAYQYNTSDNTRTPIYYKIEETVVEDGGADTSLYKKEFISGSAEGIKASDNPYFGLSNTWEGTNVTGTKTWRDDEGLEANRPDAILKLQKLVNGQWVDVSSMNAGKENYSSVTWNSLPKYDENHNEIQYRVVEESVPQGYTSVQNGNTITNVYNNMTVSAEKFWDRVDSDDDKPDYLKFKLMRTIDPNDDSSWTDVAGTEKILNKADYGNSANILKWPDLLKDDGQGHSYYYKVVEVQETPEQLDFDVTDNNNVIAASTWSHTAIITNVWKKTNISFSKQWMDDNGNERFRPNLVFALEKSTDNGNTWTQIRTVKMVNDGTGLYKPEGSADAGSSDISYTWHDLEAGDNIKYRVVETDMLALKRNLAEPGVESGDTDTGYNVYYNSPDDNNKNPPALSSTGLTEARNVNVINKSNMITIRVNKNWNGVYGDSRPDRVGYRLYKWTEEQYNTLTEAEKYTDTYKFSNKYAMKNSAGESDVIYWTWMLSEDENGDSYHYGLREFYIGKKITDDGNGNITYSDESEYYNDYEIDISDEWQGDKLQVFNVTNTWKKLNVSIDKRWDDGTNVSSYKSITMKLMRRIGENGSWEEVPGKEQKSVTAAENWRLDDAWTDLPRTTEQGQNIYYRAEEVKAVKTDDTEVNIADNPDFYTRPDAVGINSSGDSVVKNTPKKITVNAVKHWVSPRGTAKPSEITLTLMASYNGGANWVTADQINSSIESVKTLSLDPNDQNADLTTSWQDLPTKYVYDSIERDVIYKIVEGDVSGYTASYSAEEVMTNSTVTITNTENAPYTKKAANYSPNEIKANGQYNIPDLISTNDDPLVENTLSSDELKSVSTKVVNIDGEDVECYIFKWRVDLLTNQNKNTPEVMQAYTFTDTLTDGSVFYNDYAEYPVTYYHNGSDVYQPFVLSPAVLEKLENGTITEQEWNGATNRYYMTFEYPSPNVATFNAQKEVSKFSYYTATPKSVVDNAIEQNGEFVISNYIREHNEPTSNKVDMTINGGSDTGVIDKINKTASGTTSGGKATIQNGVAHYTLDVNKDSKYLSSGDTVSVTDIFRILKYKPNGGDEQIGRDVQVEPTLENLNVYYYDVDGRRSRVEPDQYSYSIVKDETGVYEVTEDYSSKFTNANLSVAYGTQIKAVGYDIPKGLEVVIKIPGTPGAEASIDKSVYGDAVNIPEGVNATLLSDTFDSSGHLDVLLKFTQDFAVDATVGDLRVKNQLVSGENNALRVATVVSAVLTSRTETTDYITKFTLPDGGHYEIMYDYVIKNPDGSDLARDSSIWLQNEATVHTSGGDKTDYSQETEYIVYKSGAQTQVGENFRIVKVDLGNKSITDLNAEFKLARYDTNSGNWIYADDYSYMQYTLQNGYSYFDESLHVASFEQELTETGGNIPDDSANMVLSGSFEVDVLKDTLYKIVEVKAPDNHEGYDYPEVPYQQGDHTVSGNSGNTYYFVYDTSTETKNALAEQANVGAVAVQSIKTVNSDLIVPNVRLIDIGAQKIWEQDPDSAVNDVEVAVLLLRSHTNDISDAVIVENQEDYIPYEYRSNWENYDAGNEAYILKKEDAWTQNSIWTDLPNSDMTTQQPYYYFLKEVAYKIGNTWYYTDDPATEYKPSYVNDAISSSGVIGISNSRKLLVKKRWEDKNGDPLVDPPVSAVDFNLYGIKSDGTEVKIILPDGSQRLTAPNWSLEVPRYLIDDAGYVRFRIEETTSLDGYIVSDVYSLNGIVGVINLINKNTDPTSVSVNLTKTWADGNDAHGTEDAVTFTLYQFTGKQTVDQTFIENFILSGQYNGVSMVNTVQNPVTVDGSTESDAWSWQWDGLPFRDASGQNKLQYFVTEEQSSTTSGRYSAIYTLDGNSAYTAVRDLDVTNKQPGVLVIKKQWRDKTLVNEPLIANPNYSDVKLKLYRKAAGSAQQGAPESEDFFEKYGLDETNDLVTGADGMDENGIITVGRDDHWTVSLSGLDEGYLYYVQEVDGPGYLVEDYAPVYSNEGQLPGSDEIITVDNFVEGERIKVKAVKNWDDRDTSVDIPDSVTLILEQLNSSGGAPVTIGSKVVSASDEWTAEWDNLPASKTYQIREEVPEGWLVSYGDVSVTTDDQDNEVRNYSVTNVIDTGQLKVNKRWLNNDASGTSSVTVGLYRQAYDANGDPVAETEADSQNVSGRFSSGRNMLSLRKVRKALAESTPSPKRAPSVSGAGLQTVNVRGSGTDSHGTYVSKEITDQTELTQGIDVSSLVSTYEITAIGLVFERTVDACWNFQFSIEGQSQTVGIYNGKSGSTIMYFDEYTMPNPINRIVFSGTQAIDTSNNSEIPLTEIRFYYTPVGPDITITAPDSTSKIAGDEITLTANPSAGASVSWSSSDENVATVDSTGKVTFIGAGSVTITATATDTSNLTKDASVDFTVSPFTINNKSTINTSQSEGNELQLSANASATWSSDNTSVATVESGNVTFVGNGTVTITATHGGATDTITFTVSSHPFTAEITPDTIHSGMTATLSTDPSLTNVVWSLKNSGDSGKVTISGNTVTANVENADVVLVAERGDASTEVTLHIRPMMVTYNGGDIIPTSLTMNVNSSIPVLNVVGASSGTSGDTDIAYYDPVTRTVKTGEKIGETSITITDSGSTMTFTVKTEVNEASANVPVGAQKIQDITITSDNNWLSDTISNLPKTDGKGNTYRYFIKEESTGSYIPVAYSTSEGGAVLGDSVLQLDLTNAATQSPVTLPESGSTGTRLYHTLGALMLLLVAAGYAEFKRRRWYNE